MSKKKKSSFGLVAIVEKYMKKHSFGRTQILECTEDDMGGPWGVPGAMGSCPKIQGGPGTRFICDLGSRNGFKKQICLETF